MKKFDKNTRQGRARRIEASDVFNRDTALPHTRNCNVVANRRYEKTVKKAKKRVKWALIIGCAIV